MKVNPEAQLKMCRFQFMKLKKNNDILCEAINSAEEHLTSISKETGTPYAREANEALEKIKLLKEKLT